MPLNKTIVLPDGVSVTYWRETALRIDAVANTMWCNLQGYLDKPAFQGGKTPVTERGITKVLPAGYLTMTVTELVVDMRDYIKIATNSAGVIEFSGATNAT